jgi:hypothetical protein
MIYLQIKMLIHDTKTPNKARPASYGEALLFAGYGAAGCTR